MKSMISDAQAQLVRAVQRLVTASLSYDHGRTIDVVVESVSSDDWASATFVGQTHRLELRFESCLQAGIVGDGRSEHDNRVVVIDAAAKVANAVADYDIPMSGCFVADIAVVSTSYLDDTVTVVIEALTLLN